MSEWHGWVIETDGDTFTAEIRPESGFPVLEADFSMSECGLSGIEPGHIIVVTPESVRLLELPPWTQEEIDVIRARAAELAAEIARYSD